MTLSFRNILFPLSLLTGLIIGGCGNKNSADTTENQVDTATVKPEAKKPGEVQKYSQVPSPGEMFSFIKQVSSKSKEDLTKLNNPDNLKLYNDNKSRALNFGVYSADLLFCSTFNHGKEVVKYFVNVKKLGDQLGISTAIDEKTANRISDNISNADSLSAISNDLYFTTFDHLESNDRGNTLALVMAGGWVESIYMVTSMEPTFKKDSPVVTRIAEQKFTLDNLLDFMKKYEKDADVADALKQLGELKSIFDKIEDAKGPAAITVKKGKKVLGGGSTGISVTADQYKAIVEKTMAIRKKMTQN